MSERTAGAIGRRWARLAAEDRKALIPFVTAGYPSRAATVEALQTLAADGADIVELGIPFSDPLADGPVIQQASFEALRSGVTVPGVLGMLRDAAPTIPVVLFSYLNPLLRYGLQQFLDDATAAGASGVLLTDLPAGADPAVERAIGGSRLDRIPLVAPTTVDDRLPGVLTGAGGFVYVIARMGVTGASTTIGTEVAATVARVRAATSLPIAVGFGIGRPDQAVAAAAFADGIVVGSALVERMGQGSEPARDLVRELRHALDGAAVAP